MSSLAEREYGVCRGSLSLEVSGEKHSFVYVVLVGVRMEAYENLSSYERQESPIWTVHVVGASPSERNALQLMTDQGSHVKCTCPTLHCRQTWLSALTGGLHCTFLRANTNNTYKPKTRKPPFLPSPVSKKKNRYCASCAAELPVLDNPWQPQLNTTCTLPQYGIENKQEVCHHCQTAQGLLHHVWWIRDLYAAHFQEQEALEEAKIIARQVYEEEHSLDNPSLLRLVQLLKQRLEPLIKVSSMLERFVDDLEQGKMGFPEFVIQLEEMTTVSQETMQLKKQAFSVAGDMANALKRLKHALQEDGPILHILEFFLDLCKTELPCLTFFWPQLCMLHLAMLPPENSFQLRRVECMEDLLLTIATQYSIHMGLELIWHHTADLEDAINAGGPARKRRFAVMRFLCELESLLLGLDQAWGGGFVCLRQMLTPGTDQMELLRDSMLHVQQFRKKAPLLSRSARLDFLLHKRNEWPPEQVAREALRMADNADYFSCHLSFTRRLCDVAEKLRFLEIQDRPQTLREELSLLNASGAMGGDPLNKVREHLVRVVRVPINEGHVFRSKERTPVLLLVETQEEGVEESEKEEAKEESKEESKEEEKEEETQQQEERDTETDANEPEKEQDEAPAATAEAPQDDEPLQDLSERGDQDEAAQDAHAEETLLTPINEKKKLSLSDEGIHHDSGPSPARHALRKFNEDAGPFASPPPAANKESVEEIVSNVVMKATRSQEDSGDPESMEGLVLPDLDAEDGDETGQQKDNEKGTTTQEPNLRSFMKSGSKKKMLVRSLSGDSGDATTPMAPTGDVRREVLTAIMVKGMQGSNTIAAGTAPSVQRTLRELYQKRAVEMLMDDSDNEKKDQTSEVAENGSAETTREKLISLGFGPAASTDSQEADSIVPTEEDEAMEALRLLLIQNRVSSPDASAKDLAPIQGASLNRINVKGRANDDSEEQYMDESDLPQIDAGDVDSRLVGCGALPPAVLQALTLWKGGMVTNSELLELVKKDLEYVRHSSLPDAEDLDKLNEDSAFWGRFAFGERWAEKKSRIASSSPEGGRPGWNLIGVIVKSNDDLRQEAFVMQLIELCEEAFQMAGLELWVSPYRILATGRSTGIIEMVRNAMSFDALKKRPGYSGLRAHLRRMAEFTVDPGEAFKTAQKNFVRSLAAYSLMSYFFLFKDRHNGNILLDTAGHVIHIDFGFVLGVAPGGSFSLEMSTPFKLTEEMLEVMGGLKSQLFSEFVTLFCCGFLALQAHCETFATLVEVTSQGSTFKCFEGRDSAEIVSKLRERFCPELDKEATVAFALDLIKQAASSYGTKQYDYFQFVSQGIAA